MARLKSTILTVNLRIRLVNLIMVLSDACFWNDHFATPSIC